MKVSKKETQLTASDRLPYEKFLQKGAESLSDAELLAIMLRTGCLLYTSDAADE